ncbi:hypothetical protein [Ruminococcus sp.]|uniref:hypothetical protein n=1 Tax=Ruminococcus sp. TaxID=41978 RepID=UPI001B4930A0|nr:hypothetical protein [Ruminococcus sp.]MBP5430873.1 hypothetical protein [Ruminococcus sp.]
MAIEDVKWPDQFEGMQLLPGPFFLRGGKMYSYFAEGNSWNIYITNDVLSLNLADYLITPSSGYNWETDWFTLFEFANGYKLEGKFRSGSRVEYTSRWLDENGNDISTVVFDGMSKGSGSAVFGEATNLGLSTIKLALLTSFPTNPGDPASGPLPDTPASGVYVRLLFGGAAGTTNALDFNPGTVCKQCMTFRPYDEVHAEWQLDIFTLTDVAAANNYFATHGNPIPSDYPQFIEDGLPQDYDPSRPGGGDGNYSDESDPIDFPDMPVGGALGCGAIKAFHVSSQNITDLFHKLWDKDIFDIDQWQKLVSSPIECIVSLHALPIVPSDGTHTDQIHLGSFATAINAPVIQSQYKEIDCGYVDLIKFFGSAMDFSPYTQVQIALPGAGIYDLATEDVQGSRIHVKYFMDILTGDVLIHVKCGQSVLYKFTGNMKMQIPVSARDNTALGTAISGVAGLIGGAIKGGMAGGGAGAVVGGLLGGGLSTAASVATRKDHVSRSGDMSGSISLMDHFVPYLIIHRPQQSLAPNYNKFKGYPANLTLTLGACSGYTEVAHIHLTGISGATDTELNEIEQMLKAGVII